MYTKYFIVANTRDQFENQSKLSTKPYSDHPSSESIEFIVEELAKNGFDTEFFGGIDSLIEAYSKKQKFSNTLFLNFSDGMSQISRKAQSAVLLELLNVPYAGSDPLARLIAGNKAYTKKIISDRINTPKSITVFPNSLIPKQCCFPVVIKPNREGSSLGITQDSICINQEELYQRIPILLNKYNEILIEEYIPGYEITCFIIGNRGHYYLTEPVMCEYDGVNYFEKFVFGLEEKATRKRREYLARNVLDSHLIEMICKTAQTAFEILNMHDFARADFRLQKDGKLFFIEINGNAVISETSEIGVISRELDVSFGDIVEYIILSATERLNINHD